MVTFEELRTEQAKIKSTIEIVNNEVEGIAIEIDRIKDTLKAYLTVFNEVQARLSKLEGNDKGKSKPDLYIGLREFVKDKSVRMSDVVQSFVWAKYITRVPHPKYVDNPNYKKGQVYQYTLTEKGEKSGMVMVVSGGTNIMVNKTMSDEVIALTERYTKALTEMMLRGVIDE